MKIVIQRPKTELTKPVPEQARGWLNQPAGKYHKAYLIEKLEELKDDWVNGVFTGESSEETAQRNAEAIGKAQAFAEVLLELDEITIEEEDE